MNCLTIELVSRRKPIGSAGVAQLVEHHVANVIVVGSNPITRFLDQPVCTRGLAPSFTTTTVELSDRRNSGPVPFCLMKVSSLTQRGHWQCQWHTAPGSGT